MMMMIFFHAECSAHLPEIKVDQSPLDHKLAGIEELKQSKIVAYPAHGNDSSMAPFFGGSIFMPAVNRNSATDWDGNDLG